MAARFTYAERLAVITEAIRLLRKPASWTKGYWKCEIMERETDTLADGHKVIEQVPVSIAAERKRERLVEKGFKPAGFSYCVEGAVNQAVVNVLGVERARKLGAVRKHSGTIEGNENEEMAVSGGVTALSILSLVERETGFLSIPDWNDNPQTTHEDILAILRRKRKEIKAALKQRTKA